MSMSNRLVRMFFGPVGAFFAGITVGLSFFLASPSRVALPPQQYLLFATAFGLQAYVAWMALCLMVEGTRPGPLMTSDRGVRTALGALPAFACVLALLWLRAAGGYQALGGAITVDALVGVVYLLKTTTDLYRAVICVLLTAMMLYVFMVTGRPLDILLGTLAAILTIRFTRDVWRTRATSQADA
jgi:hypothetical protein